MIFKLINLLHYLVYIDVGLVGNTPITLTVVTSGSGFPRTWRIKVSQIHCDSLSRGVQYIQL